MEFNEICFSLGQQYHFMSHWWQLDCFRERVVSVLISIASAIVLSGRIHLNFVMVVCTSQNLIFTTVLDL